MEDYKKIRRFNKNFTFYLYESNSIDSPLSVI